MIGNTNTKLSYFVHWHPALWTPAIRWLVGDTRRFVGKRVLDLGCGHGRMSCLFGLLGATVQGVDLDPKNVAVAREEVARWNLGDRVQIAACDGDPLHMPGSNYDFAFTKSVLVVVPDVDTFIAGLSQKLKPGAELMFAENLGGAFLKMLRFGILHRRDKAFERSFHGVDQAFLTAVSRQVDMVEYKQYYGLVAAIRARKRFE